MWTRRAILLTTSRELAERGGRRNRAAACDAADRGGRARGDRQEQRDRRCAIAWSRRSSSRIALAPEHLALHDPALLAEDPACGQHFLGPSSPEAAGDYASGPNHVLPTSGAARLRGGLSAADFVKVISVQELTPDGARSNLRRRSRRWRAPKAWKRTRDRWRCGDELTSERCSRAQPSEDGAVLAAHRRARGKAAARFQREYGGLLAAGDRVSAASI